MRRSGWRRAGAVGLLLGLAAPLAAQAEEPVPLRTEQAWFTCGQGPGAASGNLVLGSWGGQRGTARVQDGGGCATADAGSVGVSGGTARGAFEAEGTFRGRLESLTVTLDATDGTLGQVPSDLEVTLSADGRPARGGHVVVQPVPTPTGQVRYALTLAGLALEEEDEHVLRLSVDAGPDGLVGAVWVVGASDADGGVVFNPSAPAEVVLDLSD